MRNRDGTAFCVHFRGLLNAACAAGIAFDDVERAYHPGDRNRFDRLPCLEREPNLSVDCPRREFPEGGAVAVIEYEAVTVTENGPGLWEITLELDDVLWVSWAWGAEERDRAEQQARRMVEAAP